MNNPKYKENDKVFYYLESYETVIETKVKSNGACGFYWLEDGRVDRLAPEIELFDTEEECIKKALVWNDAMIAGYKSEINRLVKVNEKLKETLEKHKKI